MNALGIDTSEERTRAAHLLAWGIHPTLDSRKTDHHVNKRVNSAILRDVLGDARRASTNLPSLAVVVDTCASVSSRIVA